MRITDIKVFPLREEKLKAFVSIVLDDCFMVNDIKVIKGKDDLFISMPSRRKRNGKFKDIAHPLNNETRQAMELEILRAYEGAVDGGGAEQGDSEAAPERDRAGTRGFESSTVPDAAPENRRPRPEAPDAERAVPGRRSGTVEPAASEAGEAGKSPDEVAEHHLSDSFWST